MDTIDKVKKLVLEGNVLDDQGAWVTLAARKDTEKKIIDRLTGGKVLCNGRWVPIPQAKESCPKEGIEPPQETRSLGKRRAPKIV
jgi:hypothetical protein